MCVLYVAGNMVLQFDLFSCAKCPIGNNKRNIVNVFLSYMMVITYKI